MDGRTGAGGGGPIDVLTRQIAGIIEGAGIAEVAGFPEAGVEFDALAVVKRWRDFALSQIQIDARAGARFKLEEKLLAGFGEDGRLDDAAGDDERGAAVGFDVGRRTGTMGEIGEGAGER